MKKTLSLLASMLVVSSSLILTVACNADDKKVKSYLYWNHNEVKCKSNEDIYLTEWSTGNTPSGAILYCTTGDEIDIQEKSREQISKDTDKYADWINEYSIFNINGKPGIKWNGKYPKSYFIETWEFEKYERNFDEN